MPNHSPEPWRAFDPGPEAEALKGMVANFDLVDADGNAILEKCCQCRDDDGRDDCDGIRIWGEDARRIVACVNACKDISVSALKSLPKIITMLRQMEWRNSGSMTPELCPCCNNFRMHGHKRNCILGQFLRHLISPPIKRP